jgi:two-component system repressor protein LuxO
LPDGDGLELARAQRDEGRTGVVIVITADGSISRAVDAMREGAQDFLVKPFSPSRLLTTVRNAMELQALRKTVTDYRREAPTERYHGFVGASLNMRSVYRAIENVAQSKATVFISGESGTGKEVCASAIHAAGPRAKGPFVPLNCGAIPKDLIESELFGHLKGAFTGAIADRPGAALSANGGTLFLDEICEMDVALQTKLLRFLQTSVIQPIGSNVQKQVDVRVVCATNRDAMAEVRAGRFREDLYYRLNVLPIQLPPLRERGDDILLLAQTFLEQYAMEEGKDFQRFDDEARELLKRYAWPGNVRELQNTIRHVVVLGNAPCVSADMLRIDSGGAVSEPAVSRHDRSGDASVSGVTHDFSGAGGAPQTAPAASPGATHDEQRFSPAAIDARSSAPSAGVGGLPGIPLGGTLRDIERQAIEGTIAMVGGSVPKAAKVLGVSPSTLYRKLENWKQAG